MGPAQFTMSAKTTWGMLDISWWDVLGGVKHYANKFQCLWA